MKNVCQDNQNVVKDLNDFVSQCTKLVGKKQNTIDKQIGAQWESMQTKWIDWDFVTPSKDWDNSLWTKWMFAGNTNISRIIIPIAPVFLVFLDNNIKPKTTSAIPDR